MIDLACFPAFVIGVSCIALSLAGGIMQGESRERMANEAKESTKKKHEKPEPEPSKHAYVSTSLCFVRGW